MSDIFRYSGAVVSTLNSHANVLGICAMKQKGARMERKIITKNCSLKSNTIEKG